MKKYFQVAIAGPFLSPFDYSFELSLDTDIDISTAEDKQTASPMEPVVGGRVEVEFRHKKIVGVVISDHQPDYDVEKIKPIIRVIDTVPIFSEKERQLLLWAAHYYHEPLGNIIQAALPKKIRAGAPQQVEGTQGWQLATAAETILTQLPARATKQREIMMLLTKYAPNAVGAEVLNQALEGWRTPMKRLVAMGGVKQVKLSCLRADRSLFQALKSETNTKAPVKEQHEAQTFGSSSQAKSQVNERSKRQLKPVLNTEQKTAVEAVMSAKATGKFASFLLQGVTGSGKTETYLGMIEQVIAKGEQVLVLVPEIGLTPQTVARFEAYLNQPVAVMHSGLSDTERHCAWYLVKSGQVSVLLGTRSALFSAFDKLGLCIMDEEHDLSFKQQEGFRYSARDCLVRRAQIEQVPVVLGSATPSLESLYNVKTGRYQLLRLTQRAVAKAQMPTLKLLDIRGERIYEGVSNALKAAMQQHLEAGNQVLLFLNRRGFSPVLMCDECGWQAACPHCQHNMTFHQALNSCICHHCGHQVGVPKQCPSCQSEAFVPVGQGTERVEQAVAEAFPEARILRVDRDTTRQKGAMAKLTDQASRGEADILIGTQMLAKGHHFPKVTLVGVLDIDQGLLSADYRSPERMGQLLVQVAGRAGRAEQPGEVLIQSRQPENPMLKQLITQGYEAFAEAVLAQRAQAELPPYSYQILLRAEAVDPQQAVAFLNYVKQQLQLVKMPEMTADYVEALGPVSAPMMRRQGRYRYQLLLQSNQRRLLHGWFSAVEPLLYQKPGTDYARKVRWSIDVDPQELF